MSQIQRSAIRSLEMVVRRQEVTVDFCITVIGLCVRFKHCAKYCFSFNVPTLKKMQDIIIPGNGFQISLFNLDKNI